MTRSIALALNAQRSLPSRGYFSLRGVQQMLQAWCTDALHGFLAPTPHCGMSSANIAEDSEYLEMQRGYIPVLTTKKLCTRTCCAGLQGLPSGSNTPHSTPKAIPRRRLDMPSQMGTLPCWRIQRRRRLFGNKPFQLK